MPPDDPTATTDAGAGGTTGTPPTGTPTPPPTGGDAGAGGTEPTETRTAAELAAELKRINAESAGRRKRIEELEAAEADRKKGELGELDRLKAEHAEKDKTIADLSTKIARLELGTAVTEVATKLGFRNPSIAGRLVDLDDVKTDDGTVDKAKVEKSLRDALKADPYLGSGSSNDGGARHTGDAGPKADMNTAIRRAAGVQGG